MITVDGVHEGLPLSNPEVEHLPIPRANQANIHRARETRLVECFKFLPFADHDTANRQVAPTESTMGFRHNGEGKESSSSIHFAANVCVCVLATNWSKSDKVHSTHSATKSTISPGGTWKSVYALLTSRNC